MAGVTAGSTVVKAKPFGRPSAGLDNGFLGWRLDPVLKERCLNYKFWPQIKMPLTAVTHPEAIIL